MEENDEPAKEEIPKIEIANYIYNRLDGLKNNTTIRNRDHGEVIDRDMRRRITIDRINTDDDVELLKERGFTDDEIGSGILALREKEFRNPNWPNEEFKQEQEIRYLIISGTGKVIEGYNGSFMPAELGEHQARALDNVLWLWSLPNEIVTTFGSYDEFLEILGNRDMTCIDQPDRSTSSIMFKGGLRGFVESSLSQPARADHFDELFEMLEELESNKSSE